MEMALGRYPIPQPPDNEIEEEMKQEPAGTLPPRPKGNSFASHANAIRMPIFELLQIICSNVSGYIAAVDTIPPLPTSSLPPSQDPPQLSPKYFKDDIREFLDHW